MKPPDAASSRSAATILVVDDDRRVVELLGVALSAYGFRVLNAGDGEEAIRIASRERPDLVVLDVRLPRRSGLEVCEMLRQDPEDPQVPIIMVSAAAETESRLQGLSRGADDYVAKPFSPKELIARIKRLLARSAESREARRRGLQAEHELTLAREDVRRSHAELLSEQRLREMTHAFVREFHGLLDAERLVSRLLLAAQGHLGVDMVGLLGTSGGGGLRVEAIRGDCFERAATLVVPAGGELEMLLAGLGRPIRRRELERIRELEPELGPFIAAGVFVLAPLRDAQGLLGLLVAGEPEGGKDLDRLRVDSLAVLCDTASLAMRNAYRCHALAEGMLETVAAMAERRSGAAAPGTRAEAVALVEEAGESLLPGMARRLVARAVSLGAWLQDEAGRSALEAIATHDASGIAARLARLLERTRAGFGIDAVTTEEARAAALTAAGLAYGDARAAGLERALAKARALHGLDTTDAPLAGALERALRSAAPDRTSAVPLR
jgi:DNA-binding response OmpR family regulator